LTHISCTFCWLAEIGLVRRRLSIGARWVDQGPVAEWLTVIGRSWHVDRGLLQEAEALMKGPWHPQMRIAPDVLSVPLQAVEVVEQIDPAGQGCLADGPDCLGPGAADAVLEERRVVSQADGNP
jgi:hypothetical protein